MDRIFELIFSRKSNNEGRGLGLSAVRGIFRNHDAATNVYSESGKGTGFNIYFPVIAAAAGESVSNRSPDGAGAVSTFFTSMTKSRWGFWRGGCSS